MSTLLRLEQAEQVIGLGGKGGIGLNILCLLFGHDWSGAGWTSDIFDSTVPTEMLANIWRCRRCKRVERTLETQEQVGARYAGYHRKYGDADIDTDEFSPPRPAR